MDDGPNGKAIRGSKVDVLALPSLISSNTGVAIGSTHWCEDEVRAVIVFVNLPSENTITILFKTGGKLT